jgi:hypothetical protein
MGTDCPHVWNQLRRDRSRKGEARRSDAIRGHRWMHGCGGAQSRGITRDGHGLPFGKCVHSLTAANSNCTHPFLITRRMQSFRAKDGRRSTIRGTRLAYCVPAAQQMEPWDERACIDRRSCVRRRKRESYGARRSIRHAHGSCRLSAMSLKKLRRRDKPGGDFFSKLS